MPCRVVCMIDISARHCVSVVFAICQTIILHRYPDYGMPSYIYDIVQNPFREIGVTNALNWQGVAFGKPPVTTTLVSLTTVTVAFWVPFSVPGSVTELISGIFLTCTIFRLFVLVTWFWRFSCRDNRHNDDKADSTVVYQLMKVHEKLHSE